MNIHDIAANLDISSNTHQSSWDKIRTLPTSAELMITLIQNNLENAPGNATEARKSDKVDIII